MDDLTIALREGCIYHSGSAAVLDNGVDGAATDELMAEAADEIDRLRLTLRPFAAAYYDENGDVTISTGHISHANYRAASDALKPREG